MSATQRTPAGELGRICEHGQLRRSCDHCGDAREIAELRAELARVGNELDDFKVYHAEQLFRAEKAEAELAAVRVEIPREGGVMKPINMALPALLAMGLSAGIDTAPRQQYTVQQPNKKPGTKAKRKRERQNKRKGRKP